MNKELRKGINPSLILALLENESLYGYALIERLMLKTGGALEWKEGTLYPLLHQMEGKGWIQSEWQVAEGRRRKVYSITDKGHGELAKQKEEWVALQAAIGSVLGEIT